jgi:hypothetical protein
VRNFGHGVFCFLLCDPRSAIALLGGIVIVNDAAGNINSTNLFLMLFTIQMFNIRLFDVRLYSF